jgi:hypothetical protein
MAAVLPLWWPCQCVSHRVGNNGVSCLAGRPTAAQLLEHSWVQQRLQTSAADKLDSPAVSVAATAGGQGCLASARVVSLDASGREQVHVCGTLVVSPSASCLYTDAAGLGKTRSFESTV